MKRNTFLLVAMCLFAVTVARVAGAQTLTQAVGGAWKASVHAGDKTTTEQWVFKQDGIKLTGTVKNERGELPLTGTIEGAVLRAVVTEGTKEHQIHVYVDGDQGDGTIQIGKDVLLVTMERVK